MNKNCKSFRKLSKVINVKVAAKKTPTYLYIQLKFK